MIYAARFDTMNALLGYLTENCCGAPVECAPAACANETERERKPRHEATARPRLGRDIAGDRFYSRQLQPPVVNPTTRWMLDPAELRHLGCAPRAGLDHLGIQVETGRTTRSMPA
jgi:hypothetical protein